MIREGLHQFQVAADRLVEVRSSGPFTVYACSEKGELLRVLGPDVSTARYWKHHCRLPRDLIVDAPEGVRYEVSEKIIPSAGEKVSSLPMAVPIGAQKPETLTEIIARMLHQALAAEKEAAGEPETWDEANDFEVEDWEDEDFDTAYTVRELLDEEPFFPEQGAAPKSDVPSKSDVRPKSDDRPKSDVRPKTPPPAPAELDPEDRPTSGSEVQPANARGAK